MNDGQWLRYWCAQHATTMSGEEGAQVEDLARRARNAAERDGFSVDAALSEVGASSLEEYIRDALSGGAAGKA
jgi:hypothetical protein